MTELNPNQYRTLSFDCYGTLIDWENGILGYLQPLLQTYYVNAIDEWLLEFFAATEPEEQAEGGSYRDVLSRVLTRLATRTGFSASDEVQSGFAESIEYWPPFTDSVASLRTLAEKFELVALSNVDDDLFEFSNETLQRPFNRIITAQRVGAYKPDIRMFETLMQEAEGPILHVAQSRFHDIAPAASLGLDTVWINRPSLGAAREVDVTPTWTFESLADFTGVWR